MSGGAQLAMSLAQSSRLQDERVMAALQAQHAHWLEQQRGMEARLRLHEQIFLQATAPTTVHVIRDRIVPTTHIHPAISSPDPNDVVAQVGQMVAGMHGALSAQSARQAGDMRAGMREWLSDAQSAFRRPPTEAPQAPGYTPIASGRGRSRSPDRGAQRVPPPPPPPPATPAALPSERGRSRSMDRGRKAVADAAKRATKSAEIHAAPEPTKPRRGERSRSPLRAGASTEAVVAAVKQRAVPARVTKPKPIAAPRPSKRYGPDVGLGKASAPPPDDPPPPKRKKIAKSKFAQFVKPRAPAPVPAPAPEPARTVEEAVQREPEKKHIVKTTAAFIKKKSTKPAAAKPAQAGAWAPAAAKVPKAAPDPQDLGAPEPAAKRRKQVPTKFKKSHRPFAIAAM